MYEHFWFQERPFLNIKCKVVFIPPSNISFLQKKKKCKICSNKMAAKYWLQKCSHAKMLQVMYTVLWLCIPGPQKLFKKKIH